MKSIQLKGKNVEDAIALGLRELKTTRDNVEVDIISKKCRGLFGIFGRKEVVIKMTLQDNNIDYNEILTGIETNIKNIILLANLNIKFKVDIEDGQVCINMNGVDAPFLIGKSGDVLDAFEYLISLMVNKKHKTKVKLSVDVDNYRAQKSIKIKDATTKAVEKVLATGEEYKIKNIRPNDRKIIHSVVSEFHELSSKSVGQGNSRYIIIFKK
ncbi:MAG: KH domain-containing protein [bacterium]|nr:KH domain-containing protein [bacterium]